MKKTLFALLFSSLIYLSGCGSTGLTSSTHLTNVELSEANYVVVATNVSGEASTSALFGMSYGLGMASSQMALIPLSSDRRVITQAMENLWLNFENEYGTAVNRKLALVNMRYDSRTVNTFFYTKVETIIVADVVEFTDE